VATSNSPCGVCGRLSGGSVAAKNTNSVPGAAYGPHRRHGPNFALPEHLSQTEKDPPTATAFPARNRPTDSSLGWQIHTSAFFGRKTDLPEQADQLRYVPDLISSDRYRAINGAAILTRNLSRNLSSLVNQKRRSCISSHADFTGDRLRYVVTLCHLCLFGLPQ
jgi:hypothetical protein